MENEIREAIYKWQSTVESLEALNILGDKPVKSKVQDMIEAYEELGEIFSDKTKLINKKSAELFRIKSEIERVNKQKTVLKNMIINRSELLNAEKISYFKPDTIPPQTTNKISNDKVELLVDMRTGETRLYHAEFSDGHYSYPIDIDYGLFVNKSEKEMIRIAIKRGYDNFDKFSKAWSLKNTPDKYLCDKLLEAKRVFLANVKEKELLKAIEDRKTLNAKIKTLRS